MAKARAPRKAWQRTTGFKEIDKQGRLVSVRRDMAEIERDVAEGRRSFTQIGRDAFYSPIGMEPEQLQIFAKQLARELDKRDKREPTLYDTLAVSNSAFGPCPEIDRMLFRQAKRFRLDASASALVSHLITETAPLILREHQFARPLYPVMWVEEDFDAHAKADPTMAPRQNETSDIKVGYFIHGERVYMASQTRNSSALFMPYWFELGKSLTFEEELERAQYYKTSRLMFRQTLVGEVGFEGDHDWFTTADAADFCRSFTVGWSKYTNGISGDRRLEALWTGSGSIKQLTTMLLLLCRPGQSVIQLSDTPVGHALIKGKRGVLAPHHVVTVHLGLDKATKRILNSMPSGRKHRWHTVEGGWCQTRRGIPSDCTHVWDWDDRNHAHCTLCPAKRWWRKNHSRGDIKLGKVTKDYDVTE